MDSLPVTPLALSPLPILQPCTSTPPSPAKGSPSTWIHRWWLHWLPSLTDIAALHVHNALLKGAQVHGFTAGDSTGSLSLSASLSLTDIAALHVHAALLKGALVHGFTAGDSTGSLT